MSELIDRTKETRIVASIYTRYAKGGTPEQVLWLHPNYYEIYARDIARGHRGMLDSAPSE